MSGTATLLLFCALSASPRFAPYTSKPDAFTVDLPGTPEVEAEKDQDGSVTTTYTVARTDATSFMIDITFDPGIAQMLKDADLGEAFNSFRDSHKGEDGTITAEKKLTLGGWEGREYTVTRAQTTEITRVYFAGSRLIALVALTPHGVQQDSAGTKRVFESFKLGEAAPAAAKSSGPPADGVWSTVEALKVTDKVLGAQHEVSVAWTADVRADPSDAALTLASVCRVGKMEVKWSGSASLGPKARGKVPLELKLARLSAAPAWCELKFGWSQGGKVQPVDTECWPGAGEPHAGPCDR
jgi:hypothetical protein